MLHRAINRARQAHRADGGFTLIELLLVIVILGVLSAIVVFSVKGISDRGDLAACKSEVKTVATAEEAYYAKTGGYGSIADLQTGGFLRPGAPKYVSSASATDGTLTLTGNPSGCTAG